MLMILWPISLAVGWLGAKIAGYQVWPVETI